MNTYQIHNIEFTMDRKIELYEHMEMNELLTAYDPFCLDDKKQQWINYNVIEYLKSIPVISATYLTPHEDGRIIEWPIINS